MHHVLIVDDEPSVLVALKLAFEDHGFFELTIAASAEEALAFARQHSFDLVITDKNLPGMDGLALARALQALPKPPAIMLITGFPTAESREAARVIGVAAYLEKPFTDIYEIPRQAERAVAGRGT